MTKYLVLAKKPKSKVYKPYDNELVDHDTALELCSYLNGLLDFTGTRFIVAKIEVDELIGL